MKACPVCGLDLEDTYLFCPEDGSPLQSTEADVIAEELPESEPKKSVIEESNVNGASPVVLYCPACAAEYPLTFSECPVHGVTLTKHRIPTFDKPPAKTVQPVTESPARKKQEPINQEAQSAVAYSSAVAGSHVESHSPDSLPAQEPVVINDDIEGRASSHESSRYESPQSTVEEHGADRPSFKIAAIMIAIGLAVLSLVALYAVYTTATRKQAPQTAKSNAQSLVATPESAFIPTPEAARDYKEEAPVETTPAAPPAKDDKRDDNEPAHATTPAPTAPAAKGGGENKPRATSYQPPPITAQAPVAVKRPASATDIVLPRGTYGLVDARLLRVRGRQTGSGYRYDLTFNLQEQAGRTTQWDRLTIATHSASGIAHSEVMPFYHRLGAAGTMTFTISVELKGRSESDWQGRIICTGIGTDTQGRALRASFGANVSP